jgi:hypothetical protein
LVHGDDFYASDDHHKNGVGKRQEFSGLCEQLSAKAKTFFMNYLIIMLMLYFFIQLSEGQAATFYAQRNVLFIS